jgi:hypothetical protein
LVHWCGLGHGLLGGGDVAPEWRLLARDKTMPSLNRLRVAALLNASAGTIERQGNRTLQKVLVSAFEKHRISAVLEFLPGAKLRSAAERIRQQVVRGELDAVVVGDGDGSIRTAASVLAGSDVPLGIIPLGTHPKARRVLALNVEDVVGCRMKGEKSLRGSHALEPCIFLSLRRVG